MARGNPVVYQQLNGGVNLEAAPYLLTESQCRDCRNVTGTSIGSVRKRDGSTLLDSISELDSIHTVFPVNTSTKSLLVVGKRAGASEDRIVTVATNGTVTVLKDGLTQGQRWSFVQAPTSGGQGPIYGVNGVDPPQYWDGSASSTSNWTASTGTIPTACKYLTYHQDTIWASGASATPGRVFYSGLTQVGNVFTPDPRNWDNDNWVDIEPQDGEIITGLGKVSSYVLVFKPHNTYAIHDPTTGAWRGVNSGIGCSANRSIVETKKGTMFLSEDAGVCGTDGSNVWTVGENVLPLTRAAANTYPTVLPYACGTYFNDSYYLSLPTENSYNDLTMELDVESGAWWLHTIQANQFALLDPNGTPKLYAGDSNGFEVSRVLVPSVFTDNDANYETYWEGPFWPFGQPHLNKRMTQVRADGFGDWELSGATAFSTDYEVFDEILWEGQDGFLFGGDGVFGGVSDVFAPPATITERRYPTPIQGWGRAWSLRIENNDANAMELYSITALIRERKD